MATMKSPKETCRSEGERSIYDFFSSKLPEDYWVWNSIEYTHTHNDRVEEGEIDFIVHHGDIGMLLMEVKDWRISHLYRITKDIVVKTNGKQEGNPGRLLKNKFYHIKSKLSLHRELCDHRRRLKCWIDNVIGLPYITEEEWTEQFGLWNLYPDDVCLPFPKVFFKENFDDGAVFKDKIGKLRRFPSNLDGKNLVALDNIFRAPSSARYTEIIYLNLSDFRGSFLKMQSAGGERQLASERLAEILSLQNPYNEIHQLRSHDDIRMHNCVVYEVSAICRLVTIHHDGVVYLCFFGDKQGADDWIERHGSTQITLDTETQRITLTQVTGAEENAVLEGATNFTQDNRPFLKRIAGVDLEALVPKRLARKHLLEVNEETDPEDIEEILEIIDDRSVSNLLTDMFNLIRKNDHEQAVSRYDLHVKKAVLAETDPVGEAQAVRSDTNSDVLVPISDLSGKELHALLAPDKFRNWMLFLHPEQRKLVDLDSEVPLVVTGASGSGKTCMLVHRARRLARKYPEARIGIVTLNRSLAKLIRNLLHEISAREESRNISVYAYYDYFKNLLQKIGAEEYFQCYLDTLRPDDPARDVLRSVDSHNCVNEYSPTSKENLSDTWSEFLEQQDQQLLEAKETLFRHLESQLPGIDHEAYLEEEFSLIRSAFDIQSREHQYLMSNRDGRAIPLPADKHRESTLYLLRRYEEYMFAGGMLDAPGLSQIMIVPAVIQKIASLPAELRFHSLLIDEFQDFSTLELSILKSVPTGVENALSLFGDLAQKIFAKSLVLDECGLEEEVVSRHRILKNYRNSKQILETAVSLIHTYAAQAREQGVEIETMDPEFAARETAYPIAYNTTDPIREAWDLAREWIREKQMDPWSVCLATAAPSSISVQNIIDAKPDDVEADFLTGDYIQHPTRMVVGEIGDVKGFEFSMIIILGCSEDEFPNPRMPSGEYWRDALRMYVAMTRGRDQVALLYQNKSSVFLDNMREKLSWKERGRPRETRDETQQETEQSYTGAKLNSFTFLNQEHSPRYWWELQTIVAEAIYDGHKDQFHKCLGLRGPTMRYFAKDPSELRAAKPIGRSGYFLETRFSNDTKVKRTRELMGLFGYAEGDLTISTRS